MDADTKIFKTLICTDNAFFECDTILWHGEYWLVPEWLEDENKGKRQPVRIILLDNLPHQESRLESGHHFVLNEPIPKRVFDGQAPSEKPYRVINFPKVFYDIPPILN